MVPLAPFRERFEQMEPSQRAGERGYWPKDAANTVAVRLGWYHKGRADGPRVRRLLGLRLDPPSVKSGKLYPPKYREGIRPEMALRLCDALDMDPCEVDL